MRLLLGLVAIVASAASIAHADGYENGREYIYDYYAHLHTHMPSMEQQVSGMVMKCRLIVQPRGDYMVIRPTDMMFDKVHKDVVDFDEHMFNYKTIDEFTEHFSKPFKIRYDHGKVRSIQLTREEPLWSINMKKAIASAFNMDLEAMNPIIPKDEKFFTTERIYGMGMDLPTNYRIYEDGIYGECETLYDIQRTPWPNAPYMNVMNVTKVKNYQECRNTPYIFFGVRDGSQCVDCPGDVTHPLTSNAAYHYDIRGTRHSFIIERMMADGEIMYSPYTPQGNTIRVLLNRTMNLMEIRDARGDIPIHGDIVTHNKLSYIFTDIHEPGNMIDLKSAHKLVAAYGLKGDVDEVGRIFKNMIDFDYAENEIGESIKKDIIPLKFLELIYSFVLLDYQQIDDFYHRFVEPVSEDGREAFLDLLSAAGTNPAFMYSKHLIQAKKISMEDSIEVLTNMPFHIREPSEILFDEFYRLCEASNVRDVHPIHSACLMAFSSLVHETCIIKYHNTWNNAKDSALCTPVIAAKYFNYLVPQYERNLEEYERIMYIKVAGGFGVKEALPYLERYATDKTYKYPAYIRMLAIWMLENPAKMYPEKVREIVLPIYRNWSETHEIRLAAFTIIMKTSPDMYLLKSIAAELVTTEPNTQVISYVWTYMKELSESDYPCHWEMAQSLRYVIPIMENENIIKKTMKDWAYSKVIMDSGYEEKFNYGGFSTFSYIMANDTYLPRTMMLKLNDYRNNFNYDTLHMTFDSWGMDKILDKYFGPRTTGNVSPGRSLWNFFGRRRSTRDVAVNKEVKEIDQNLHIETRDYDKAYMSFRIAMFNNDIFTMTINETTIENIMKHNEEIMPAIQELMKEMKKMRARSYVMGSDMSMFIPTELGLPFYLESKQPVFIQYKSKDLTTSIKQNEADKSIEELTAVIKGHFMYDSHTIETASILVPFEKVSVGVGYDSRSAMSLPIDMDMGINMIDGKMTMKTHPETPHEIFRYQFKPFSFVESFENALPVIHEDTTIDIFMEEDLHKFEKEYLHDILGVGIKMSGHYLETPDFWGSWRNFWHTKDIREKSYYINENPRWHPRKMSIMMTPANRDITNEMEITMAWKFLIPETRGNTIFTSKHFSQIEGETFSIRDEARSYTTVMNSEITLRGQRERKLISEMVYTRTRDLLTHHLNFFYDRTPFSIKETDNMKICFHGSMKFPPVDFKKIVDSDIEIEDSPISTNVNMNFGKDCKTDHKITMKGIWERTDEQKHLIENREVEEPVGRYMKNPYIRLWRECINSKREGITWSNLCDKYYFKATEFKKFKADIEYENLSNEFIWYINNIRRQMRHIYFPWLVETEDMNIANTEGKIEMIANVSTWDHVMDVCIRMPHENVHYKQLPVPDWYITPRTYAFFEYTNLEQYSSIYRHRYCDAQGTSLKTFDGIYFPLPDTDCFKVLAKDCSPNEHFLILGAKNTNANYPKSLRVFMHTFKIEIMAITNDGVPVVRVNGKKVPVTPDQPFHQYMNTGARDIEIFHIESVGPKPIYRIVSDVMGLRIASDGMAIFIQVAPFYRGKVCGLCGDYNFNKFHEFTGPDKCVHPNATSFAMSYVVPSGTCTAPPYRSPCDLPAGGECTLMRTNIVEVGEGKNRQVCFSITPVPKCSETCTEGRIASRDIGHHCLPAKDPTTKTMIQQAERRPLTEFRRKREDRVFSVQYPENCSRN